MADLILHRRGFLIGLGALIAAPAIVRITSIMPVRAVPFTLTRHPLYDSDSWQRVREDFYHQMVTPPLIQNADGTYSKLPFAFDKAQEIMAQQKAARDRMDLYFMNRAHKEGDYWDEVSRGWKNTHG